jgi:hypothetical protein
VNTEITQQVLPSPTIQTDVDASANFVTSTGVRPFLLCLKECGARIVFILQFVFFSSSSAHFLNPGNLINITPQASVMANYNHSASEGE